MTALDLSTAVILDSSGSYSSGTITSTGGYLHLVHPDLVDPLDGTYIKHRITLSAGVPDAYFATLFSAIGPTQTDVDSSNWDVYGEMYPGGRDNVLRCTTGPGHADYSAIVTSGEQYPAFEWYNADGQDITVTAWSYEVIGATEPSPQGDVEIRYADSVNGSGSSIAFTPHAEAGDTVMVQIGGGNNVTSWDSSWHYLDRQTGVEAQGTTLWKVAGGNSTYDVLNLTFDGSDPYRITWTVFKGEVHPVYMRTYRDGVIGTAPTIQQQYITLRPGLLGNDALLTHCFTRNGSNKPALSNGSPVGRVGATPHFSKTWLTKDAVNPVLTLPPRTGAYVSAYRMIAGGNESQYPLEFLYSYTAGYTQSGDGWWDGSGGDTAVFSDNDEFGFNLDAPVTYTPEVAPGIVGIKVEVTVDSVTGPGYFYVNCAFDRSVSGYDAFDNNNTQELRFTAAGTKSTRLVYPYFISTTGTQGYQGMYDIAARIENHTSYDHGYGSIQWQADSTGVATVSQVRIYFYAPAGMGGGGWAVGSIR